MSTIRRGVAICHYNRGKHLYEIVGKMRDTVSPSTKIVVCDDGSNAEELNALNAHKNVIVISGPNLGVAANKNRALWALQDCDYICILEDDLKPVEGGWFDDYEKAAQLSGIHHFCRVQDKETPSQTMGFDSFMAENGLHPIYGTNPRGDFTFLTSAVIRAVGAFNPTFRGAGYAHGEWSDRVARAGLINHPQKWIDIKEGRDKFIQVGDTEGGRWTEDEDKIRRQLLRNKTVLKELQRNEYTYHPLVLE